MCEGCGCGVTSERIAHVGLRVSSFASRRRWVESPTQVSSAGADEYRSVPQVEPPSPSVPPASQARSAPSMSDAGKAKDAVRVPGSVNTFLNAANPRPHNGVVAYPFKLGKRNGDVRSPSPNPSTMTLDSNADDRDFEMPTGFGVVTPVELPTEAYAGRAASPGVVEMPALVHSPETDIVPAELAVPQPTLMRQIQYQHDRVPSLPFLRVLVCPTSPRLKKIPSAPSKLFPRPAALLPTRRSSKPNIDLETHDWVNWELTVCLHTLGQRASPSRTM